MAASAEQIARLRRMVNEPTSTVYTDSTLASTIERYPLVDALGRSPTRPNGLTPPGLEANPYWTATYDLNAAAADLWDEKAAALEAEIDATLDNGVSFSCSQRFKHAVQRAKHYRARRSLRAVEARPEPSPANAPDWVVNAGCD